MCIPVLSPPLWIAFAKLTGIDRPPLIDPLYWHGRAPAIGYWALGITVALAWIGAFCWILYVVRTSRRETAQSHDS